MFSTRTIDAHENRCAQNQCARTRQILHFCSAETAGAPDFLTCVLAAWARDDDIEAYILIGPSRLPDWLIAKHQGETVEENPLLTVSFSDLNVEAATFLSVSRRVY